MEQVEGGELHVNKGTADQPASSEINEDDRNLNAVEGFEQAHKMASAEMEALLKRHPPEQAASDAKPANDLPITVCPVYLRLQPVLATLPWSSSATEEAEEKHLYFLLLFQDPRHSLSHRTLTQSLPAAWLEIPFEENEWVENEMVDVIRKGVELIGQVCLFLRAEGLQTDS
jgi:hypothetical protein